MRSSADRKTSAERRPETRTKPEVDRNLNDRDQVKIEVEQKKKSAKPKVLPENGRTAEVVDPVVVAVVAQQPVADDAVTPLARTPRNNVVQHHPKDEIDPGKIFQISSYNSFQPIVRRSPSMLEKIKLFSEAAEAAKEQVVNVRHSYPSFNPLLPKGFYPKGNLITDYLQAAESSNGNIKSEIQNIAKGKKLKEPVFSELRTRQIENVNNGIGEVIEEPIISVSTLKKHFLSNLEEKAKAGGGVVQVGESLVTDSKRKITEAKRVFESNDQLLTNDEKRNLEKFDVDISDKKLVFESQSCDPAGLSCETPKQNRNTLKRISFLDESLRSEIKRISGQIYSANKEFFDEMKKSGSGKKVSGKKMFSECDLGKSTYRDWELPIICLEGVVIESLDLAAEPPLLKRNVSSESNFERDAISDSFRTDFSDFSTENLIHCPKRASAPRNMKPKSILKTETLPNLKSRKSAKPKASFPRSKSVESEVVKWDTFLKEIGRLSIEIDDEHETFI